MNSSLEQLIQSLEQIAQQLQALELVFAKGCALSHDQEVVLQEKNVSASG
jgi:hypothetical protein